MLDMRYQLSQETLMRRKRILSFGLFAAAVLGAGGMARADGGDDVHVDQLSRSQVEQIVHDYLLHNPEILFQAAQEYKKRHQPQAAADIPGTLRKARASWTDPGAPSIGSTTPKVTLVEFFDFRCPYCRRMVPVLDRVAKDNPDLRIVFKDMPILGSESK